MNSFFKSLKFKMIEKRLEKTFGIDRHFFGTLESIALSILSCPKVFLPKDSLLRRNKYITFDFMIVSLSYARHLLRNKYKDSSAIERTVLVYVYDGSTDIYGISQYEIMNTGIYRVSVFDKIFLNAANIEDAMNKLFEEAVILFAHDYNANSPSYYGENTPLTILPINIQTRLERETYAYLTPLLHSMEKIIYNL